MMTENSGTFQLASSISPSNSPSSHVLHSNSHDAHTIQQQISQQGGLNIKPDPDYEYVDEVGNPIIAHNYSRNHVNNEEQAELLNTSTSEQPGVAGGLYHCNINNSSNAGAGGGGGGGGGIINETGRRIVNNNTMQQNQQIRQQSPLSPPPPQQVTQIRNPPVRCTSPATAWHHPTHALVSTSTATTSESQIPPSNAFGILRHEQDVLHITETCIEIGRNSSTSSVHFHVAKNSFVSRKHFQILYDPQTFDFYLICLSKNGIFVDDVFQRRNTDAVKLPKSCTFRFPSTEIRIAFESFSEKTENNPKTVENANVIYSPLKISIPKQEQKSPYPSPTGTISAANSCPTSPRQGFQEYHQYNYNNNNNFQNNQELFQPPSTSTYNEHEKPPYSYAQLIVQSISAAPDKQLTLSGIYSFISKHYPYYRKEANKGWQNSIRHNLSLNRYFIKVARSQDEPGKGSFWRIDPNSEAKLIDQSYKKRRQRGSQCFRPPYGMPRSAPVSPSHIDNSRENSPLHDIVLQSAPGSPGVSYQNNHGGENNHTSVTSNEETNTYGNQGVVQQQSYNSHNQHNQYNNSLSGYYSSSSSTLPTSSGPIGPLKRHQPSSSTSAGVTAGGAIIQGGNSSNIYDEISDYGQGAEIDECETIKRQKYTKEIN